MFFYFFFFLSFLQHRQSLLLYTVWFLCCLKDTKKKVSTERLLQLNFGSMDLSHKNFLCIMRIALSNSESCQGPLKSADLWLTFPSQSSLLIFYLCSLKLWLCLCTICCTVDMWGYACERESRDVSDVSGWNKYAFIRMIHQWNSTRKNVFHTGHLFTLWLMNASLGFCVFCWFVFDLLNMFTKKKKIVEGIGSMFDNTLLPFSKSDF